MDKNRAIQVLRDTGALLEGHFILTSGLHSERYVQCALLLSYPDKAIEFMENIANYFRGIEIDTVVAPAVGGIIVSYDVAKLLKARAIFTERVGEKMSLRRGFGIDRGEKCLIVEDVITTGGSVMEVREVVDNYGGEIVGYGCIVDRSAGAFNVEKPFYSCIKMEIPTYEPDNCPLCKRGLKPEKPGSRDLRPG